MGQFQVLKNHAPIVSSLDEGVITILTAEGEHEVYDEESGAIKTETQSGKEYLFKIQKGFIEVLKNEISLLVQGVNQA